MIVYCVAIANKTFDVKANALMRPICFCLNVFRQFRGWGHFAVASCMKRVRNNLGQTLKRFEYFMAHMNAKKEYDAADANSGSVCE